MHSIRALLREFEPFGASPISVMGTEHSLEFALQPDPQQIIKPRFADQNSNSSLAIGEPSEIIISGVHDRNGNNIIQYPVIRWRGTYLDTGFITLPKSADIEYSDGKARAVFQFYEPGKVEIVVTMGELRSDPLLVEVLENPTPTPGVTSTMVVQAREISPTVTLSPTEIPVVVNPPLVPTTTDIPEVLEEPRPDQQYLFIVIIFVVTTGVLIVFFILKHSKDKNKPGGFNPTDVSTQETTFPFQSNKYDPLHKKLTMYFSEGEINSLCFSLDIDYENLPSSGKANKAREMIIYCVRTGRLEKLKQKCRELRPHVEWD